MTIKTLRNIIVLHLLLTCRAPAEMWRSILYPETWTPPTSGQGFDGKLIQDFSYAGVARGERSLPEVRGPVFDVSDYGADATGEADSTDAVQSAIDAAGKAGGGVVQFKAGTYLLSPRGNRCLVVQQNHVILRGASGGETRLLNTSFEMRQKTILLFQSIEKRNGSEVRITRDSLGPTHNLMVADARGFRVGDRVEIRWDFTPEWIEEHHQSDFWNEKQHPGSAVYQREVSSVHPGKNQIGIDIPTRYQLRTRDLARIRKVSGLLTGCAVENIHIGNVQHPGNGWGEEDYRDAGTAAYDAHDSWAIRFHDAIDCWVADVSSFQPEANRSGSHILSNGVLLSNSTRVTIRGGKFQKSQYGGGGGNGYMLRLQNAGECLVEGFESNFSRHGISLTHAGSSGNVFYRCVDRATAFSTGSTGSYRTNGRSSDHHMHFSHANLFDSCLAENSYFAASHRGNWGTIPHGLTSAHGVYWNIQGEGGQYPHVVVSHQGRYGYVIGTRGTVTAVDTRLSQKIATTTRPEDHTEGIGEGAHLAPQSLYQDQLNRRLGKGR